MCILLACPIIFFFLVGVQGYASLCCRGLLWFISASGCGSRVWLVQVWFVFNHRRVYLAITVCILLLVVCGHRFGVSSLGKMDGEGLV